MSKPWLSAKTAGEAFNIAYSEWWRGNPSTRYADALSAAVIEWHESQREKVGERYEVAFTAELHAWVVACPHKRAAVIAKKRGLNCKHPVKSAKIIHVTRYRMKSKGAKR